MKSFKVAIGLMMGLLGLAFSSALHAQTSLPVSFGPIMTPFNTVAANAPYRVCLSTATGIPCSTAGVTIYSDPGLTQVIPNIGAASSQGIITFFTIPGAYIIQVNPLPGITYTYYEITPGIFSLLGGVTGAIPYQSAPNTTAFLPPNTTSTREFLVEQGTGAAGAPPFLDLILSGDIVTALTTPPPIGGTTPSSGNFTSLNSSSGALNGTIGAITPSTGSFTTIQTSTPIGITSGGTGVGTAPLAAQFLLGQNTNTYLLKTLNGDCVLDQTALVTCSTFNHAVAITGTLSNGGGQPPVFPATTPTGNQGVSANQLDAATLPIVGTDVSATTMGKQAKTGGLFNSGPLVGGARGSGGIVNGPWIDVKSYPYLAKGDGQTDDHVAIQAAIADAKAYGSQLRFSPGVYYIGTATLDVSGLTVKGSGAHNGITEICRTVNCTHTLSVSQNDIFTTTGITDISDIYIDGGWNGSTASLAGNGITCQGSSTFCYEVRIHDIYLKYIPGDAIHIHNGGYSSIYNIQHNAASGNGLVLTGDSASNSVTTVNVWASTFDNDQLNGVLLNEVIGINTTGVITEGSGQSGFKVTGIDNRSLAFISDYCEVNTIHCIDLTSSQGIGLTIIGTQGSGDVPFATTWMSGPVLVGGQMTLINVDPQWGGLSQSVNVPNNTATTMVTFATGLTTRVYNIQASLNSVTNAATLYTATAQVVVDGTSVILKNVSNGTNITVTISGQNLQVTQTSGGTVAVIVRLSLIG